MDPADFNPATAGMGERLRQARLAQGLSLAEVEQATHIRQRYLLALERDDWAACPGKFYARAFFRSYARFLGLMPDTLLADSGSLVYGSGSRDEGRWAGKREAAARELAQAREQRVSRERRRRQRHQRRGVIRPSLLILLSLVLLVGWVVVRWVW